MRPEPHTWLNALPRDEAHTALARCCGARRWIDGMLERRPFASRDALLRDADEVWSKLGSEDYLEAFSHHPRIGASLDELRKKFRATADLSGAEQSGLAGADDATLERLQRLNTVYAERFGFIFIVCATGKTAAQMLALLEARSGNDPQRELAIAAGEQAKITRLRLERLGA